jgi:hypothetical protein
MLSFEQFVQAFGNVAPNTMNMSIYRDNFQCACGSSHWFDEDADVVCQGASMTILVVCPDDPTYLTNVKIKTFMVFKFKGFESLAGTHLQDESDITALRTLRQIT